MQDCYKPRLLPVITTPISTVEQARINEQFLFDYVQALLALADAASQADAPIALEQAVAVAKHYHEWRFTIPPAISKQTWTDPEQRTRLITYRMGTAYRRLWNPFPRTEPRRQELLRQFFESYYKLADDRPDSFGPEALSFWVEELKSYSAIVLRIEVVTPTSENIRRAYQDDFEYKEWWMGVIDLLERLRDAADISVSRRAGRLRDVLREILET